MSDEWQCRVLPRLGLGTKEYIKAGHAALVLIHDESGEANYYDFGRYVTPEGKGRVRSAQTDVELRLPFDATLDSRKLKNLDEFLIWLSTNPKKTHGEGRLLASVCEDVDFLKAKDFILNLQGQGSVRYGAFTREGSNCSRFVTDTIIASTQNKKMIAGLTRNKRFTPSGIGNVKKAASDRVFVAEAGRVDYFKGSALKENLTNYFDKNIPVSNEKVFAAIPSEAQLLTGIGSNAHFHLQSQEEEYSISRYNDFGEKDFEGRFTINESSFDINAPYRFIYDSHCLYCHVQQGESVYRFDLKKEVAPKASLTQRERIA